MIVHHSVRDVGVHANGQLHGGFMLLHHHQAPTAARVTRVVDEAIHTIDHAHVIGLNQLLVSS